MQIEARLPGRTPRRISAEGVKFVEDQTLARDHSGHSHGSAGHSHGASANADSRYLTIAFVLIVAFMAFEIVVGILAHSLALLSDAAHMLTDAGALALSLVVIRYVPPAWRGVSDIRSAAGRGVERASQRSRPARARRCS